MVIDTNNIGPAQSGTTRNSEADSSGARSPVNSDNNAAPRNNSDTVELSAQARNFDRVRESLQNLPDVDRARVDSIKQQIADGSYQIDAEQVAAKILSNDQNFSL